MMRTVSDDGGSRADEGGEGDRQQCRRRSEKYDDEGEAISDDDEGRDGRADGEGAEARRRSRQACLRRLEEEFNNDTFKSKPCQFIYMRTVSKELRG